MTAILTDHSAGLVGEPGNRDGFGRLLRAEWTKFRTVRGWMIGLIVAAILTVGLAWLTAAGSTIGCSNGSGTVQLTGRACLPPVPIGPGGEAVNDSFYFVRQSLTGNGSITVAVTSFTGRHIAGNGVGRVHAVGTGQGGLVSGTGPWSKAGIIIKQSTKPGSAYAAMMVTGSHGVRMQYDYVSDIAGLPGRPSSPAPRWLRLVREGDTIAGYDSADGIHWARVGTATLAGLSRVVQVGLFATSPQDFRVQSSFGGQSVQGGPSLATGVFDHVRLSGAVNGTWTGGNVGSSPSAGPPDLGSGFHASAGTFAVSGSGDIGPIVPGPGGGWYPTAAIEQNLAGAFIGLIAILVVAAMFFTAEYRRGLIRITLAASPRRGQVLAAKAIVAGLVTFAVGLVAVIVSIAVGVRQMRSQGLYVLPVSALTEARVIVGTAAMLGVMAVFAVALGAVLRRSAITITVAIVAIVLPFLFAALNIFPYDVTNWLLRVTPAAGFAIEQSIPHYSQVNSLYQPANGSYPLPPLAGFAVLCAWTAAALMLALILLRRRDA